MNLPKIWVLLTRFVQLCSPKELPTSEVLVEVLPKSSSSYSMSKVHFADTIDIVKPLALFLFPMRGSFTHMAMKEARTGDSLLS